MCVCVCKRGREKKHACTCVCVREKERERVHACVCVCACASLYEDGLITGILSAIPLSLPLSLPPSIHLFHSLPPFWGYLASQPPSPKTAISHSMDLHGRDLISVHYCETYR